MSEKRDDDTFLGYVDIHCETNRALFHARDIKRLFELAGEEEPEITKDYPNTYLEMHEDIAKPLIKKAREIIKSKAMENLAVTTYRTWVRVEVKYRFDVPGAKEAVMKRVNLVKEFDGIGDHGYFAVKVEEVKE